MRPCFAFSAKTATKPAVLAIDDEIGFWGVQARDFRAALNAVEGDDLHVEINSPGGDVIAGLGMYNMLRTFAASGKQVTTRVTGVAASIASIVMLAGDKREMPSNAFAMIHSVASGAWGTADDLRDHADTVDKIQASLRNIYVERMGVEEGKATEMMAKDTWLTAAECLETGFITNLTDAVQATAKFDMARAELPEHVAKVFAAAKAVDTPTPPVELSPEEKAALDTPVAENIVAEAKTAGLDAHAQFLALSCATLEDAKARMVVAREIVALCKVAGMDAKASDHIRAGKSAVEVRAALVEALANEDTHVESAPRNVVPTNGGNAKPAVVNTDSIWASHNSQMKKGR